jgi:hypothetical protein
LEIVLVSQSKRWSRAHPRAAIAVAALAVVATALGVAAGPARRHVPPTATPPARSASVPPTPSIAVAVLATLAVKGRAPKTGYDRDQFGPAWTDDNDDRLGHNGCDTRNDILRRDLARVEVKPGSHGCAVLFGTLVDPYTGRSVHFARGVATSGLVQIDHVVALSDAWQTGAQLIPRRNRVDLANDPLNLIAVEGSVNAAKGDGDAATWLPPARAFRCAYVARQVAVKARYRLWVTPAERAAIERVLAGCPGQSLPDERTAAGG